MSEVVIVGAGGHARVVADALVSRGVQVRGFVDPSVPVGSDVGGFHVLGDDSWLINNPSTLVCLGIGATKDVALRERIFGSLADQRVIGCTHATAIIGTATRIHATAQVLAGCIINHSAFVGANTVLYTGSIIEHDCVIGEHSYLSPRVTLCGGVKVGARVFIGAGATVLPNVKIGDGATIAAGAVVTSDVDANRTVMGVPAKVVDSPR
jgi:UDP-perosamine 4-acetyltransferase